MKKVLQKKSSRIVLEYLGIFLGCLITSVAFTFLINPYKLVPGGVYGSSIVLHNLFPALQVGTFSYMISIPLLLLSYFLLGKNIGARTLMATLITPAMMNGLSALAYSTPEALQALDPHQLCGGYLDCSNDMIVAVIIGSVLIGVGEGLLMRCKATSGGSDIVAMLLHKYLRVRFSRALMGVDATVITIGMVVIGLGIGDQAPAHNALILAGYSLICIWLMSTTVAYIIAGSKNNKLMFVVTDDDCKEAVRQFVLHKLDRTATSIESHGLYSQENKCTLMMVVRLREVDLFTTSIMEIDPGAFVIVTDAYDAYGNRWKAFPKKNALQLS